MHSSESAGRWPGDNCNLLRLLLASMVVFSHSFDLIDRNRMREPFDRLFHTYYAGDLAIDGFFLLSGFLIAQSWHRDPHLRRYLARRILRIYPAFIVVTLICGLVLGPLFGGGFEHYFGLFRPDEFIQWMLLLREPAVPPVFLGSPYSDVNGPMWTIQYEFMCYVLVACAGLVAAKATRTFWWSLWLSAITLNLFFVQSLNQIEFPGSRLLLGDEPASLVRFLTFFCAGVLMFLHRNAVRFHGAWAVFALTLAFAALFRFDTAKLILPTAGAYALFWFAFRPLPASGIGGVLRRFTRRVDLSYGVYLFGWPVQQVLIKLLHLQSPWLLMPLALVVSAGCAFVSWHLVERPFLLLKPAASPHERNKPADTTAAVPMAAAGVGDGGEE